MVRFIKGIFNHEPDNISLNFIAGYRFFKAIEVAKLCKNFVLLELKTAFKHSPKEHDTVKNLIQELIDQIIDPDTFRRRLREAFNFKDFLQLYHFAFLENHVTELRKSLMSGHISINGSSDKIYSFLRISYYISVIQCWSLTLIYASH